MSFKLLDSKCPFDDCVGKKVIGDSFLILTKSGNMPSYYCNTTIMTLDIIIY